MRVEDRTPDRPSLTKDSVSTHLFRVAQTTEGCGLVVWESGLVRTLLGCAVSWSVTSAVPSASDVMTLTRGRSRDGMTFSLPSERGDNSWPSENWSFRWFDGSPVLTRLQMNPVRTWVISLYTVSSGPTVLVLETTSVPSFYHLFWSPLVSSTSDEEWNYLNFHRCHTW